MNRGELKGSLLSERELLIRIDERQSQLIKKVEEIDKKLDETDQRSREALLKVEELKDEHKAAKRLAWAAVAGVAASFFKGGMGG